MLRALCNVSAGLLEDSCLRAGWVRANLEKSASSWGVSPSGGGSAGGLRRWLVAWRHPDAAPHHPGVLLLYETEQSAAPMLLMRLEPMALHGSSGSSSSSSGSASAGRRRSTQGYELDLSGGRTMTLRLSAPALTVDTSQQADARTDSRSSSSHAPATTSTIRALSLVAGHGGSSAGCEELLGWRKTIGRLLGEGDGDYHAAVTSIRLPGIPALAGAAGSRARISWGSPSPGVSQPSSSCADDGGDGGGEQRAPGQEEGRQASPPVYSLSPSTGAFPYNP